MTNDKCKDTNLDDDRLADLDLLLSLDLSSLPLSSRLSLLLDLGMFY